MMQWFVVCVLAGTICSGGGVTKTSSGIEKFWTDDYKIFEQVYGKTSDKEIYGATLPPSISFAEPKNTQASEKKERYLLNYQTESDETDPYGYGDKFNFLTKPAKMEKPATSTFNFISYSDFKPISLDSDPETYNYLKHLEDVEQEKISEYKGAGGFKPYTNYVGANPEETKGFKSIQEILDAHEANKAKGNDSGENSKYLTYRDKNNRKTSVKKPLRNVNEVSKPRCLPGRCRKRSAVPYRVRSRPHYRIKHRYY